MNAQTSQSPAPALCLAQRSMSSVLATPTSSKQAIGTDILGIVKFLSKSSKLNRKDLQSSKDHLPPCRSTAPPSGPSAFAQNFRGLFQRSHLSKLKKHPSCFLLLKGNRRRPSIVVRQHTGSNMVDQLEVVLSDVEGDWRGTVPVNLGSGPEHTAPTEDSRFLTAHTLNPFYGYLGSGLDGAVEQFPKMQASVAREVVEVSEAEEQEESRDTLPEMEFANRDQIDRDARLQVEPVVLAKGFAARSYRQRAAASQIRKTTGAGFPRGKGGSVVARAIIQNKRASMERLAAAKAQAAQATIKCSA